MIMAHDVEAVASVHERSGTVDRVTDGVGRMSIDWRPGTEDASRCRALIVKLQPHERPDAHW